MNTDNTPILEKEIEGIPIKNYFSEFVLERKKKFHEMIHAAFILDTSVCFYLSRPKPTEKELSWLSCAYPNSLIDQGNDQGANYLTITPRL